MGRVYQPAGISVWRRLFYPVAATPVEMWVEWYNVPSRESGLTISNEGQSLRQSTLSYFTNNPRRWEAEWLTDYVTYPTSPPTLVSQYLRVTEYVVPGYGPGFLWSFQIEYPVVGGFQSYFWSQAFSVLAKPHPKEVFALSPAFGNPAPPMTVRGTRWDEPYSP